MSLLVGITVEDHLGATVDGVSVEIYDRLGVLVSSAVLTGTGGPGRAEFTLTGSVEGTQYHARIYYVGAGLYSPLILFADRRTIVVYEPLPVGVTNEFTTTYNTGALSPATDPNMCRCHAQINKQNNQVYPGYVFYIRDRVIPEATYAPIVGGVSGAFLAGDRLTLRTDSYGQAVFDLVRNGIYTAFFPDRMETPCDFIVPDQASADLIDLIWLYPKSATYSSTAVALNVGDSIEIDITQFLMSNDREADLNDVDYSPSSFVIPSVSVGPSIVSATWGTGETILITALAAGVAEVVLEPIDPTDSGLPVRLPRPPVSQTPIAITVT